ncbi:hypothetical protein LXL04_003626 [Taraxacum kok-saghyz]
MYPTSFLQKSIRKSIFMAGPTEVANRIKEIINWWISVRIWMKRAIGLGLETCSLNGLPQNRTSSFPNGRPEVITRGRPRIIEILTLPIIQQMGLRVVDVVLTPLQLLTRMFVMKVHELLPPLPAQPSDVGVDITNVTPPS